MKKHRFCGMIFVLMLGVLWLGAPSGSGAQRRSSDRDTARPKAEPTARATVPASAPARVISDLPNKIEVLPKTEPDHKILPLEIIQIDVFGETNLSKEHRVRAGGDITVFLLGQIKVAGKTTTQVENELKELLGKDYLVDPQVIVTVKEYRNRYVNVMGEVVKAGAYPLQGEEKWTILDAIGQAGGFTRGANRRKIEFTHKGKVETYKEDELKKMDLDPKKVIYVEAGDTINVRPSWY